MNVKSDSEYAAATLSVDIDVPWKLCVSLWTTPIRASDFFSFLTPLFLSRVPLSRFERSINLRGTLL